MDQDEITSCLLQMEKMGLVRRHNDPLTKEILWELTPKGIETRDRLAEIKRTDTLIN